MRLIDIKKPGEYILTIIEDGETFNLLKRYGFIPGLTIKVLQNKNGNMVVEVLDSKYTINHVLAKKIIVK